MANVIDINGQRNAQLAIDQLNKEQEKHGNGQPRVGRKDNREKGSAEKRIETASGNGAEEPERRLCWHVGQGRL